MYELLPWVWVVAAGRPRRTVGRQLVRQRPQTTPPARAQSASGRAPTAKSHLGRNTEHVLSAGSLGGRRCTAARANLPRNQTAETYHFVMVDCTYIVKPCTTISHCRKSLGLGSDFVIEKSCFPDRGDFPFRSVRALQNLVAHKYNRLILTRRVLVLVFR